MSAGHIAIIMWIILAAIVTFELYVVWKDDLRKKQEAERELERRKAASKLKPFHFNPSQDEWY